MKGLIIFYSALILLVSKSQLLEWLFKVQIAEVKKPQ